MADYDFNTFKKESKENDDSRLRSTNLDNKYVLCLFDAKKYLKIADHMISVTFNLVKDPKLLVAVLENVFLSLSSAMGALLYLERKYKNIPPFRDSFESKFNMFKLRLVDKFRINKKYLLLIRDVRDLIVEHKNSPVEFKRRDEFVICDEKYQIKVLKQENIKKIVEESKSFINMINSIVKNQDVIYRRC